MFLQGIIQAAVGFYHLERDNLVGAESQLERARAKLAGYPRTYAGVDVDGLRDALACWIDRMRRGEVAGAGYAVFPRIRTGREEEEAR